MQHGELVASGRRAIHRLHVSVTSGPLVMREEIDQMASSRRESRERSPRLVKYERYLT